MPFCGCHPGKGIQKGRSIAALSMAALFLIWPAMAGTAPRHLQKQVLAHIRSPAFLDHTRNRRCSRSHEYQVVLIDNFTYPIQLTPEVATTHGELMVRLLKSGRTDIRVKTLNTTLAIGLARVIHTLSGGGCADAVISSIPGSNYTYSQMAALLPENKSFNPDTRLSDRKALAALLNDIAFKGFPSVSWMEKARLAGINLSKLKEDAVKLAFIQALGKLDIPMILPHGNPDTRHKGEQRTFNPMTLADNALVFSGLNRSGSRVKGYPYSPLNTGDALAEYTIRECPHPTNPALAVLDINEDGWFDYVYPRPAPAPPPGGPCISRGTLRGTSLIPPHKVKTLLPARK